jgi:hypothetical protein
MTYPTTKLNIYVFLKRIQLIWHVTIFYFGTCHSFGPSLIIIMDDGDQYLEKKIILCLKNFIMPHVRY